MNLEPSGRPVQQILDDAVAGRRISAGDAHTLLREGDLLDLGMAAHEVRNRFNDPEVATYNVDRNINYTNICVYKCRFCAFYRAPGPRSARTSPARRCWPTPSARPRSGSTSCGRPTVTACAPRRP